MEDGLVLEIKPKFIMKAILYDASIRNNVRMVTLLIGLSISAILFFSTFGIERLFSISVPLKGVIISCMIIAIFTLIVTYRYFILKEKKTYENTKYTIYKDKIVIQEEFPQIKQETIYIENIKDVKCDFNIQKLLGACYIELVLKNDNTKNGLLKNLDSVYFFKNIENPQFVFAKLKELIEKRA